MKRAERSAEHCPVHRRTRGPCSSAMAALDTHTLPECVNPPMIPPHVAGGGALPGGDATGSWKTSAAVCATAGGGGRVGSGEVSSCCAAAAGRGSRLAAGSRSSVAGAASTGVVGPAVASRRRPPLGQLQAATLGGASVPEQRRSSRRSRECRRRHRAEVGASKTPRRPALAPCSFERMGVEQLACLGENDQAVVCLGRDLLAFLD